MSNVWKLVPVKPTPKMIHAMDACNPSPFWKGDVYAAMLAAAPQVAPDVEALQARIAELERQLVESRDFAISEAAKIRAKYEHQQTVLVDAANAVLDSDGSRGTYDIVELEKSRTRLNAALAAVKGEKP